MMTYPTIRITCFGAPQIAGEHNAFIPDANRKAFLLLNYLQATGRELTRDRANILLWPDTRTNNNLNREITTLRKHFGSDIFPNKHSSRLKYLYLQNLQFDTDQFKQAVESDDPADWLRAANLYKGDYLESIDADDTELAGWLEGEREFWRLKGVMLLELLVHSKMVDPAIEQLGYNLLWVNDLDEDVYFCLLTYLGRNHRWKEIEFYFANYVDAFRDRLYQGPSKRMTRLSERISGARSRSEFEILRTESIHFVGRDTEITWLKERLTADDCRLITLKGIGGIGKTLLAKNIAEHLKFSFLDGIYFIQLENVHTLSQMAVAVAEKLNIHLTASEEPIKTIANKIRSHDLLLILDNFDHLIGQAGFVRTLLEEVKGLKCLVTSREILNLKQEEIVELKGLTFPPDIGFANDETGETKDTLAVAEAFPAVFLFLQRIALVRRGTRISANDLNTIGQICQELQGSPLGIELAAACVRHETVQQILKGIQTGLGYLENKLINKLDRHNGLRAVFNYSWELLPPVEQEVLAGLSVFLGGFQREAFVQIFGDHHLSSLYNLIDKSLVQHDSATGRYSLHPAIHEFAAEKLESPDSLNTAYNHYYIMTLIQHNAMAGNQTHNIRVVDQDMDNVLNAWVKTIAEGDLTLLKPSGFSLLAFYELKEGFKTGFDTFQKGYQTLENRVGVPQLYLNLFKAWLGNFSYRLGLHQKAIKLLSEAQYFFEHPIDDSDQDALIFTNYALSITLTYTGEYLRSIECAEKSLEIFASQPALQFPPTFTQLSIALPLIMLGRLDEAEQFLKDCVISAKTVGDSRGELTSYALLAQTKVLKSEYEDGAHFFKMTESSISMGPDRFIVSFFNSCYGEYLFHLGDFKQAKQKFEAGLTGLFEARELWQMQRALQWLAVCQLRLGAIELAENYLQQAYNLHQDSLGRMAYLRGIYIYAEILFAQGEDEQAQTLFDFAVTHPSFPYDFRRLVELGPHASKLPQLRVDHRPVAELDDQLAYHVSNCIKD